MSSLKNELGSSLSKPQCFHLLHAFSANFKDHLQTNDQKSSYLDKKLMVRLKTARKVYIV